MVVIVNLLSCLVDKQNIIRLRVQEKNRWVPVLPVVSGIHLALDEGLGGKYPQKISSGGLLYVGRGWAWGFGVFGSPRLANLQGAYYVLMFSIVHVNIKNILSIYYRCVIGIHYMFILYIWG